MSVTIRTKRTNTPGTTPSNLELGEMAVNIPDKKIWIGDGTASPALIADYNASAGQYYEGNGINVSTNNTISLDLSNGLSTIQSVDKYDRVPFLEHTDNQTKLVSVRQFLNYGLSTSLSTDVFDGTNSQRVVIAIQDNNPDSFRIETLQNSSGVKQSIVKIDTESSGATINLAGSSVKIQPTTELIIGCSDITSPTILTTQQLNITNLMTMNLGGNTNINGLKTITSGSSGNIYIEGNLIVSGYLETDVGVRGGTDAALEYLGEGMVMDGGTF